MKLLAARTSVTRMDAAALRSEASPCFAWECYPEVSVVV
jgi:hypothetical protein